jgi:Fur family ferric uptake transcriptional regulator
LPDSSYIAKLCYDKGLRLTEQRRVIAKVLADANDHPDVEELHARSAAVDSRISIATVYRTLRLFEELEVVTKHDFGDQRARYELADSEHHDHIIDLKSGKVIEFENEEIERLQEKIVNDLGYELVDHKLELYVLPRKKK